jgi:hypothetical protein
MNRQTAYAIALGAGIAAGLMALAGLRPSAISLPLLIAAPLPVYVASLGWGTTAGIIAAIVATAAGLLWHGVAAAAVTAGLLFAPAALAGHLANLAQPDPQGKGLIWFPLSGILLRLMGSIGVGFVIAGIALGYEANDVTAAFVGLFREVLTADPGAEIPSEEMLVQSARTYAAMLPAVVPAMWLMAHVLVMHIAAVITARSGLLARPPEDIAANMRLPSAALAVPALGLAGMMMLPSPGYEISAIAAGVGIAAFALSGIAELHVVTRGRPSRGIVLFFAWLTLVVFGFPVFVFAAMGVARSLRAAPSNLPPPGTPGPGGIIKKH